MLYVYILLVCSFVYVVEGVWFAVEGEGVSDVIYNKYDPAEHDNFMKAKVEPVLPLTTIPIQIKNKYKMWRHILLSVGGEV